MSESNIMMVNPNEIVIDMPVDEQNVTQKMESMKERGIIQPVTLWLQGMRVIDGFHRSVAAQRLGWNEIPCYVVDCSEDAFWDARIQSARQHHRIENERLKTWIVESWKSSEFYKPQTVDAGLVDMYSESAEYLSLIETLWTVYRKNRIAMLEEYKGGVIVERINQEIHSTLSGWLQDKAAKWGVREDEIVESILLASPMRMTGGVPWSLEAYGNIDIRRAPDQLAAKNDLSFLQRQRIADSLPLDGGRTSRKYYPYEQVKEWVEKEVIEKPDSPHTVPFVTFWETKQNDAMRQREIEEERKKLRAQSPQGQAEAHKRKVQTVKEAMDRVVWTAESVEHLISDNQDFSTPIAEAIAVLTDFHREHFKRKDTKIKDLVIARNAQLRREVKALTEKVESLERALNTKQAVTPRLKNVMVEHAQ